MSNPIIMNNQNKHYFLNKLALTRSFTETQLTQLQGHQGKYWACIFNDNVRKIIKMHNEPLTREQTLKRSGYKYYCAGARNFKARYDTEQFIKHHNFSKNHLTKFGNVVSGNFFIFHNEYLKLQHVFIPKNSDNNYASRLI